MEIKKDQQIMRKRLNARFYTVIACILLACLAGCTQKSTDPTAAASVDQQPNINDTRETLESAAENGNVEAFIANMRAKASANIEPKPLAILVQEIAPHVRWYKPEGEGSHPVMIFMHGCSGATLSHEEDWAKRLNSEGVSLFAVDSYSGRGLAWEDVCNFEKMTPWQRSGDVHASIAFLKDQANVDLNNIYLAGFSHGAMSVWAFLEQASTQTPSIGLDAWPETNLSNIKAAFMFYGGCAAPWNVDIDAYVFLGSADRYIKPNVCDVYETVHSHEAGPLTVKVYPEATHTFDHSRPNQANIDAGSLYNAEATEDVWQTMRSVFSSNH